MARPRKNDAKAQGSLLTPDEAAEIPVEEQPYPLPEGWKWVRLGATITLHRGVSYRKNDAHSEPHPNDYLIMRGGNICEGEINLVADNVYVDKSLVSQNQIIRKLDIIIVTSTGSKKVIGRAGISFQDYSNVAFGAFLTLARVNEGFNKRYISMYFQTDIYRHRIRNLSNGININNVKSEYITKLKLPLPQLDEQQRIVDRIESLFAKLDEAKEKAEAVLDGFESRKAAILHKAFTGELTAKWREKHGVRMKSWEKKKIKEIATIGSGGTPDRSEPLYYQGDIPWVKTGEIKWNHIKYSEEYISESALTNSSAKIYPIGTVLVAMYGQGLTRGRAAILDIEASTNQAVCALIASQHIDNHMLFYYFMYNYWNFRKQAFGGVQPNYSASMIGSLSIDLPIYPEQKEIVRCITSILEKEQQVKEAAENVLNQIDLMKKAILAKAFRGKLTGQVHNQKRR